MIVRKAIPEDISTIVDIHLLRFSSFFLTTLGPDFLMTFYKAFLGQPGILLVLEDEGSIRGFAAGSTTNQSFFKKLVLKLPLAFALQGIKLLIAKPAAVKRLFSNVGKAEKTSLIFAELLSIATLKNTGGYGKILLREFEKEVKRLHGKDFPVSLTTDFEDNDKAVDFYKNAGYQVQEKFYGYKGRKMLRFIKNKLD